MSVAWPDVPPSYRGGWQRTLYAEPAVPPHGVRDTATRVVWLQTAGWHADLRVPAKRPSYEHVRDLDDCHREQLLWLADQTAFAGLTQVEDDVCTWHRAFDLAPSLTRDSGLMTFVSAHVVEECHPHGHYLERWERLPNSAECGERVAFDERGRPIWLQCGDHAIALTHRAVGQGGKASFAALDTLDDDALRWRASLRLDYLCRTGNRWRVALSTHPWREGRCRPSP